MTHQEIFTYIYDNKVWGEGSGGGSNPENNTEYIEFLQNLLKEKEIKSVVDFGCGDWQFSQLIDWSGIEYLGIDCVESVVKENKEKFENEHITYFHSERRTLLRTDLLIVKDVFQHWNDEAIIKFLNTGLDRSKYILITNSKGTGHYQHPEITGIITRPISALDYPLNKYNIEVLKVLEQNPNDIKEISLITKK
jgi:hypothetical protein